MMDLLIAIFEEGVPFWVFLILCFIIFALLWESMCQDVEIAKLRKKIDQLEWELYWEQTGYRPKDADV